MRSHRRRGPLEHVLVAADLDELPAVRLLLAGLPADSYGQVYVELPQGAELPVLDAPARVQVNRVLRPVGAEAGARLAAAVDGWVAEWAPDEADLGRAVSLRIGISARHRLAPVGAPLLPL